VPFIVTLLRAEVAADAVIAGWWRRKADVVLAPWTPDSTLFVELWAQVLNH
jgi:hypothetical protein